MAKSVVGVLWFASAASAVTLPKIYVDPAKGGHFVDDLGRVRMFRGVNAVNKAFPWYDVQMLDDERIATMASGGFNVVRLGAMWTGFEPEKGQINQSYVDILKTQVAKFADAGIYTVFDMHQDCLWEHGANDDAGSGYWGVPPWIKREVPPVDNFPSPFEAFTGWFCAYFSEEVSKGFQDIYDNVADTRESFVSFWRYVASTFSGSNGVFGYELMNEPWAGNVVADLSLMLPGVAGRRNLAPLYERAHTAIREVDDETFIFYEGVTWGMWLPFRTNPLIDALLEEVLQNLSLADVQPILDKVCAAPGAAAGGRELRSVGHQEQLDLFIELYHRLRDAIELARSAIWDWKREEKDGNPPVFGPGFSQVPGGADYMNRTVLSWHWYCPLIGLAPDSGPYDPVTRTLCDEILGPMAFKAVEMWSEDLGEGGGRKAGHMLTEFGICVPDSEKPDSVNTIECEFVLAEMDKKVESWTYWDTYGILYGPDFVENKAKYFVRPFPTATHGMPHSLSFDVDSAAFSFEFYPAVEDVTIPTEIFVPEMHYPNMSYNLNVSPDLTFQREGTVLKVFASEASSPTVLSFVTLSPRTS